MQHSALLNEDFPSRLEAVFADRESAEAASAELCERFGFDSSQLSIVTPDRQADDPHRNRFAVKAGRRRLQRRQIKFTLAAFALLLVGLPVLQLLSATDMLSGLAVSVSLAALVTAAIVLTVVGLLSWGVPRKDSRLLPEEGDTAVLRIDVHDVSEHYELRRALVQMGADAEASDFAGLP